MKEIFIDFITSKGEVLPVCVVYKKVKNYSIKVKNNRLITVTCNRYLSIKGVLELLREKEKWLFRALERIDAAKENLSVTPLINMFKIRLLGNQKNVEAILSERNNVVYDGSVIKLYTTDLNAKEANIKLLEKWFHNYAYKVFEEKINLFMPIMDEMFGIKEPSLVVRRMKGVWGNCRPQTGRLTINEYLLMTDEECVESVILHELAHFAVTEHNKRFYDLLIKIDRKSVV